MPAYIVRQPNGQYARFSTICDDFTHIGMTIAEVFETFREKANYDAELAATQAIKRANERGVDAWDDAVHTRKRVHGGEPDFMDNVLDELEKD